MFFHDELKPAPHCIVVAEVGNVHDGSLGNCHAYIDAVADAGADAVKFQAHYEWESTEQEQFPARFSFHPQDRTRRDYWRRMSFALHEWMGLSKHARDRGLEFIVSPFSKHAVTELANHVDRWKVASGETTHWDLLNDIKKTKLPIVVSTGMAAGMDEINSTLCWLRCQKTELAQAEQGTFDIDHITLLQCTTEYPTPFEHVGINLAWQYSRNMTFRGGLSDHSGTVWPGVIAAYLGAAMVEVHVCWSKKQFGCDVSSSLTIEEFGNLCQGVRAAEIMRANPVQKEKLTPTLSDVQCYRQGKRRTEPNMPEIYAAVLDGEFERLKERG